ncbi:hypothetical protein [Thermocrispum agreste]|uniref:Uncharacterized protein n=1 Tax=Thermocrispum agreste TaxID=37925 RepID=A0A2W4JRV2_9PSEU|nr:hypothetical protein [Thermocrispum agreste]PZN00476.1 MAG: hypothetical protein DIU77_03610 [Thermocrispum agreste]
MTWNSGPMVPPPPGQSAADTGHERTVETDTLLFTTIAQSCPGIVRTLTLLIRELTEADLEPATMRMLGERIQRIGEAVSAHAKRSTWDE